MHCIADFRRLKITPASLLFCGTVRGRTSTKRSWFDRWYEAMAEWGALSMGFTLGMLSGQFMTLLTGHKSLKAESLRAGVRTQETQKPFSPRSCSSENPQHLAHVWSQERYDLHWQPALLWALASWLRVTQGKHWICWGFYSHVENLHTHQTKLRQFCLAPSRGQKWPYGNWSK